MICTRVRAGAFEPPAGGTRMNPALLQPIASPYRTAAIRRPPERPNGLDIEVAQSAWGRPATFVRVAPFPAWQWIVGAAWALGVTGYFIVGFRLSFALAAVGLAVSAVFARGAWPMRPQLARVDDLAPEDVRVEPESPRWVGLSRIVVRSEQESATILRHLSQTQANYVAYLLRQPRDARSRLEEVAVAAVETGSRRPPARSVACFCGEAFTLGRSECPSCSASYVYRAGRVFAKEPPAPAPTATRAPLVLKLALWGGLVCASLLVDLSHASPPVERGGCGMKTL